MFDEGVPSTENLLWVAVTTPTGAVYVLGGANSPSPVASFAAVSTPTTPYTLCGIPYGPAGGSLSISNNGNSATAAGCSGTLPLWYLSTQTQAAVESDCTGATPANPTTTGSGTYGDTSAAGLYTVLGCYTNSAVTGQFSADSSFTAAPEFALGIGLVFAIGLIGLLYVRKHSIGQISVPIA